MTQLSFVSEFTAIITTVCYPALFLNLFVLFLLSTLWSVYLLRKLIVDFYSHKKKNSLRRFTQKYIWQNNLKNSKSNQIKNILLLVICITECILTFSLLYYVSLRIAIDYGRIHRISLRIQYKISPSYDIYETLINSNRFRICNAAYTISVSSVTLFVRILTQYMVEQYSYYKSHMNLKLEIIIPISCLVAMLIMGIIPQLIMLYNICIVLFIIREYILLFIESKKLRLLLKQRLEDAIHHENQSKDVILYYKIAQKEYKYCSIILLISFFLHNFGLSLYCLEPILMTIVAYPNTWFSSIDYKYNQEYFDFIKTVLTYDEFVIISEIILITLGTSLQIIPYLIVSIRRTLRVFWKRFRPQRENTDFNKALRVLIENNQLAYRLKHL